MIKNALPASIVPQHRQLRKENVGLRFSTSVNPAKDIPVLTTDRVKSLTNKFFLIT